MARLAGPRTPVGTKQVAQLAVSALLLAGALASCTTTARISDVYTALDSNGDRRRNVFFTDTKEIHCVVEMGIGRPGATVEVLIRQLQAYDFVSNKTFDTDRVSANTETSPSPSEGIQKVDVVLKPESPSGEDSSGQPFQPGRFRCEARLDGVLEQSATFNVAFPDCPSATIKEKTFCYGFYKKGDVCRKYGLTSQDPAMCRCSEVTGWECDPG